jgi:outer membrane scaffolding protein for murein synthesis (MipA/OmpV family)
MVLAAHPAEAQTPSPLAEWQYSSGIQLQRLFEPEVPKWEVEVGLGAQLGPIADGLRRYTVSPGPAIDIRYKDKFFISSGEGIGVNLLSFRHISVGAAVSYDLGRPMHIDGEELNGLGNIKPAPEGKIFATYALATSFPLTIRVDARKQFGATNGYLGDIGVYMPMPGSSRHFAWFAGPTTTIADGRYMQAYFGVSKQQAASTHYREFKAHGGFKSAGFGISAVWYLTPHWYLDATGAANYLLGDAQRSPITEVNFQGVGSISAIYRF